MPAKPTIHCQIQADGLFRRDNILAALDLNDGNQARTSEQLQIGSATLYRKLKKYSLSGQSPARRDKPTTS